MLRSPAGEASCLFTVPLSEDRIDLLVMKLGHVSRGTRRMHSEETEAARELGGKLFESVFGGEVRAALRSSLDEALRQDDTGLRLKLRLQDAPELADLPWEFLFDSAFDRFFAQSNQTPIVRYLEMPERIKPLEVELPLRVLVMISSPRDPDYPGLDIAREESMLRQALDPLARSGRVRIDWMEDATLANLQRRLRAGGYNVFHFIGHGGFDRKLEEGVLVLEDEQRRGWPADARRLGTLLHDHRSLRLAVLNACEGARNSRQDPFAGVATTLIRQGIPAVVAMQFEITDKAAITFAGEFYAALAEGFPVDAAVAEARKAIYAQPNDVEWGTPVLYLRAPDGVLFSMQAESGLPSTAVSTPSTVMGLPAAPRAPDAPVRASSPGVGPQTAPDPVEASPPARRGDVPGAEQAARPQSEVWSGTLQKLGRLNADKILGATMATERYGHTVEVDADDATLRKRVRAWAEANAFSLLHESPTVWKLERGKHAAVFRNPLDITKRHAEVLVESDGRRPAVLAIEAKVTSGGMIYGAQTREYWKRQIEDLVEYLRGVRG